MPCESIIVTAFNSRKTIDDCLKAVKASTFKDYELIVVDDCSQDGTPLIAKEYADRVIELDRHGGGSHTRMIGIQHANGEIIVNVDSDILIERDILFKINEYFSRHPEIDALAGCLSKKHRNKDFFSQYKNLYMHYIFSKLPEKITFLYGSLFALRRKVASDKITFDIEIVDDTALGQQLLASGKQIAFVKELAVEHLKKYNLFSFIRNDFFVPFYWADVFITYKGWKQLFKNKTGFAHSPKEQIISVIAAPGCVLTAVLGLFYHNALLLSLLLFLMWVALNVSFIYFLTREKGFLFGISAFFVTFLDNIVMATGIICGAIAAFNKKPGHAVNDEKK